MTTERQSTTYDDRSVKMTSWNAPQVLQHKTKTEQLFYLALIAVISSTW